MNKELSHQTPPNPYAPPAALEPQFAEAVADSLRPTVQLYSVAGITLATFLGSLLAGAVLMMLNYLRVGRQAAAWGIFFAGAVAMVGVFTLIMFLPEDAPNWLFVVGQTVLAFAAATALQRQMIAQHERQGGKVASSWWAAGISILISVAVVIVFVAVLMLLPESWLPAE